MNIIRLKEVEGVLNQRGVLSKKLVDHQHTRVMNLILEPGDAVPEHQVPVDVFFYIISGKGTIQIGDEKAIIQAEEVILCPPNTKMALWADQKEKLVFLNVKTPNLP